MKKAAIILGGGRGTRLGRAVPKQFARLGGKPLFDYSVEKFLLLKTEVMVAVLVEDYASFYQPHPAITAVVPGGATRQQSVLNGLRSCPEDTEVVLIHDAARPFFPVEKVAEALKKLTEKEFDGLALAIPSTDTLAEVEGQQVVSFPDRRRIFRMQTPQLFRFKEIRRAYEEMQDRSFTDDLSLALAAGLRCGWVEGSELNFKITTELDWQLAGNLLESGRLRL